MLYDMLSECCDEYKLIQLYQKSSVWCFASSHTSTFELISSVATALARSLGDSIDKMLQKARRYGFTSTLHCFEELL